MGCISAEDLCPPVLQPGSKRIRDPSEMWTQPGTKPLHQQPQEDSRTSHGPESSDNRTKGIFLGKMAGQGLSKGTARRMQAKPTRRQRSRVTKGVLMGVASSQH